MRAPQLCSYILQLALTLFTTSSFLSKGGVHYRTAVCDEQASGTDSILAVLGWV
jgi:hypothetical protein